MLRYSQIGDLPVGRSADEVIRLVTAFKNADKLQNNDHIRVLKDLYDEDTYGFYRSGHALPFRKNDQIQLDPFNLGTPLEYACCGLSESQAKLKFGDKKVSAYKSDFSPPEFKTKCYLKVIVLNNEKDKVVGFHLLAPNPTNTVHQISKKMKYGMKYYELEYDMFKMHPTY